MALFTRPLRSSRFQMICILMGFLPLFKSFAQSDQLQVKHVHPVNNPLVDSIVGSLVGAGVIVENIKSNLSQTTKAIGTFKAPQGLLGIREGVMMVTGVADTMAGPNTGGVVSAFLPYTDTIPGNSEGRQMLNKVLQHNAGATTTQRTTDCVTIQFDIIPATDSIKFNYVFASEEYNTFVCSNFNDIFGFFIKGPGITGDVSLSPQFPGVTNIARVPGTDIPVSINTVNNGTPGSGSAANCTFTPQGIAAYIDNTTANQTNPFIYNRLKFNGLTRVLTAGVKVIPCQVYTLTLTISDVSDRSYDSGVFIEKGSLRSSGVTAVQSSVFSTRFPYAIVDCNPGKFIFERCAENTVDSLVAKYKLSGTAVNGVDYMRRLNDGTLVPMPEQFTLESGKYIDSLILVGVDNPSWANIPSKTVVVKFLNSTRPFLPNGQPNFRGDSTTLTIRNRYLYKTSNDISICQGSDSALIPVTPLNPLDRYTWRELTAAGDTVPSGSLSCLNCQIPRTSSDSTTTYIVYLQDSLSGCKTSDTVQVKVFQVPTLSPTSNRPGNAVCRGEDIRLFANPLGFGNEWTYQWMGVLPSNAVGVPADSLKQLQLYIPSHRTDQFYKIKATNELGCNKIDSIEVRIIQRPSFKLPERDTVCYGQTYKLVPLELNDSLKLTRYSWSLSDDRRVRDSLNPSITIRGIQTGNYILLGSNACFPVGGSSDTFRLHVVDSISAAFTYRIKNDSLTAAPVQFEQSFRPLSYSRIWKLRNDALGWDTTLLGESPLVTIRRGGEYESEAIVFTRLGSKYCADTVSRKFKIDPLGSVFIPNLVTDNADNFNSTFRITARDENGNILREITNGKLKVYNRWGKLVFESDDYNNDLNYSKLKEDLNDGVYFFEFSVDRYNYRNGGWLRIQR